VLVQAQDGCDALVKFLYGKLFDFLLRRINKTLAPVIGSAAVNGFIGVLDIFGFESFSVNRFEQVGPCVWWGLSP
jgi:myosin-5